MNLEKSIESANEKLCFDAAVSLVKYGANSKKMLRQKLKNKGFDQNSIEFALDKLEDLGFINERRLLISYAFRLATVNFYGAYRIKMELLKKFDRLSVEKYAKEALSDIDFAENAKKLAEKYQKRGKNFVIGKLSRNGFTKSEIISAIKDLKFEEN